MIKTKFGTAKINSEGYYHITSVKEGHRYKKLHRLIYEDFHKCTLISDTVIHHKDGNKLNNSIDNLKAMTLKEHISLHHRGKNYAHYGKSREEMPHYNKPHSKETKDKISKKIALINNSSGILRVSKEKNKSCKQGFTWRYRYRDENGNFHRLSNTNLNKLKQMVLEKGLEWIELDKVEVEKC